MVQNLFCLCLQHSGFLAIECCFDTMVENLITTLFHLWADVIRATHDKQFFL